MAINIGGMSKLKDEFLELLDKDREFRYTVAGYLGLSEVLKRLDRLEEGQNKLWQEVKALREDQEKLWENQNKLWESQNKLWEEVRALREGQNKLWEEVRALREGQNKLWEEVRDLRASYGRLERTVESLRDSMIHGFGELSKFAGLTFEEFTRRFLSQYLRSMNIIPKDAELNKTVIDGEEINLFFEDPLIVGEVTSYAESSLEVDKLIRKVEVVKNRYGKEPLKYLLVLTAKKDVAREMKKKALEKNVELVIGKEVEA